MTPPTGLPMCPSRQLLRGLIMPNRRRAGHWPAMTALAATNHDTQAPRPP